jgi:hypothetical protein
MLPTRASIPACRHSNPRMPRPPHPAPQKLPADAWLVESVIPLGFTDDGRHIELVSFLVPLSGMGDLAPVTTRAGPYVPQKTHTRVFCIVQSPLGLEVSQTEFCGLFPSGYYPYLQSDASLLSLDAWEHLSVGAANVFVLVANVGAMGQDFIHSDPDRQMAALLAPLVLPYTAAGGFQQFGSYASSQASLAWTATKTTVVPYAIAQAHHAKEAVVSCYYKAGVLFDNAFMRIDSTIGAAKYKLAEKFGGKAARMTPKLGRKLEYFLGNATGDAHNIERSTGMLRQLQSIGLHDNPATRKYLTEHLATVVNNPSNLVRTQANGHVVRESLLMGPNGGVKFETVWDGAKLITGKLIGGN